ncbi:PI31 proteasome regulator N-terminal-domain-containing protein [Hygrophoropsis aurantiaca]|uniref:PI31 proteasome regulator N-terminal-domain-containing protein n=1 Tax=Hygrophoropsis aurantiaca TaxID=72124 RepID=A0ACB8ASF3_9AGAM|nr:PI31 proteasome regulator N-terminal-domain-containing protein [Hygrophoropsis aurantiaca]
MSNNVLDPSALTGLLGNLLPPSNKVLNSPLDGLAALVHAALTALAFRLVAIDDSSPGKLYPDNVLPDDWNTHTAGIRTFRYKHDQSSLEFVVNVTKLGQRTQIHAIALENDKSASLDVSTNDFVSPSFYPHDLSKPGAAPVVQGFISSYRITDFVSQLKQKIIQRIVPGLQKEGYTEEFEDSSTNAGGSNPLRGDNRPPARPPPEAPDHSQEHYPYRLPAQSPPLNPLEIGRRDLEPFGPNPFAPPPLFSGHGGDGMFVGPDHPIFGVRDSRANETRGPWGGDGFLPPMGAPPGARFDPVGPGLGPFAPGFGQGPRGGPPRRAFGGDPDNDEFMPPGAGDMFM